MAQYYLNTASTGTGDGTTTAITGANAAWKNISEITGLVAGDTVSFNKGNTWRETLTVPASGSDGSPITFNSYGSGADPIINGSDVMSTWVEAGQTIRFGENTADDVNSVTEDCFLYEGAPTSNYNRVDLRVANVGGSDGYSLMRFDVSAIPDGATINTATLTVTIYTDIGANTIYVHKVLQINWTEGGATWNTYDGSNAWNTAGCKGDGTDVDGTVESATGAIASITIVVEDEVGSAKTSTDFAATVQAALGGDSVEMILTNGTATAAPYIDSSESTDGERPYLTINYTLPNVWEKTGVTTEPTYVWIDGVLGSKQASAVACTSSGHWYWAANVLYVYHTEDPDGAIVVEASQRAYGINGANKDYITVDGLNIQYAATSGIWAVSTTADNDNWIVQNCSFSSNGDTHVRAQGQETTTTDNWLVDNNTFGVLLNTAAAGIWRAGLLCRGMTDSTISNNTFAGVNQSGIVANLSRDGVGLASDSLIIESNIFTSNKTAINLGNCSNSTIRYNSITGSAGAGIAINNSSDGNSVYYNLIFNCAGSATAWNGIDVNADSDNGFAYNNVVYKVKGSCMTLEDTSGGCDGWTVKNNIFDASQNTLDQAYSSHPMWIKAGVDSVTLSNNTYYPRTGGIVGNWKGIDASGEKNLTDWNTASGDTNSLDSDPLMTDPASGDFTLQSRSPCIDKGTNVSLTTDYLGNPVPVGGGVDIGAYERQDVGGAMFFGCNF